MGWGLGIRTGMNENDLAMARREDLVARVAELQAAVAQRDAVIAEL